MVLYGLFLCHCIFLFGMLIVLQKKNFEKLVCFFFWLDYGSISLHVYQISDMCHKPPFLSALTEKNCKL